MKERLKMSLSSILRKEIDSNKELRERLLLVGFASQKAKVAVNELEETLQHWPEGQHPDILTAAFSHIKDIKQELEGLNIKCGTT